MEVLFGLLHVPKRSNASVACSELSSAIMAWSNDRSFKFKLKSRACLKNNVKFDKHAIGGVPNIRPSV